MLTFLLLHPEDLVSTTPASVDLPAIPCPRCAKPLEISSLPGWEENRHASCTNCGIGFIMSLEELREYVKRGDIPKIKECKDVGGDA